MSNTIAVGVTHDVVIYEITGVIPPIGLVLDGYSQVQVSRAPTFAPRLSVGSPGGLDYSQDTSHYQQKWDGRSDTYDPEENAYFRLEGLYPDPEHDYRLRAIAEPSWAMLPQWYYFDLSGALLWQEYWGLTNMRAPLWKHPGVVRGVSSFYEDYN